MGIPAKQQNHDFFQSEGMSSDSQTGWQEGLSTSDVVRSHLGIAKASSAEADVIDLVHNGRSTHIADIWRAGEILRRETLFLENNKPVLYPKRCYFVYVIEKISAGTLFCYRKLFWCLLENFSPACGFKWIFSPISDKTKVIKTSSSSQAWHISPQAFEASIWLNLNKRNKCACSGLFHIYRQVLYNF